jgi:hypothetical protein
MTMARAGALWCTLSHQRIQFALSPPPILILACRFDRQFILPLSLQRRVLCVSHLLPNLVLHPQTPLTSKWRKSPMCSSRSMPMLSLARLWYVFAYSVPNAHTYSHLFINLYSSLPLAQAQSVSGPQNLRSQGQYFQFVWVLLMNAKALNSLSIGSVKSVS